MEAKDATAPGRVVMCFVWRIIPVGKGVTAKGRDGGSERSDEGRAFPKRSCLIPGTATAAEGAMRQGETAAGPGWGRGWFNFCQLWNPRAVPRLALRCHSSAGTGAPEVSDHAGRRSHESRPTNQDQGPPVTACTPYTGAEAARPDPHDKDMRHHGGWISGHSDGGQGSGLGGLKS